MGQANYLHPAGESQHRFRAEEERYSSRARGFEARRLPCLSVVPGALAEELVRRLRRN